MKKNFYGMLAAGAIALSAVGVSVAASGLTPKADEAVNLLEGAIDMSKGNPYEGGWRFDGCSANDFNANESGADGAGIYYRKMGLKSLGGYNDATILYMKNLNVKLGYPVAIEAGKVYKLSGDLYRRNGGDVAITYNFYLADNLKATDPYAKASVTKSNINNKVFKLEDSNLRFIVPTNITPENTYFLWEATNTTNWQRGGLADNLSLVEVGTTATITFDVDGGNEIAPIYFVDGETYNLSNIPDAAKAGGYEFNGWYLDKACTQPAPESVTTSTTLYAGYNYDATLLPVAPNMLYNPKFLNNGMLWTAWDQSVGADVNVQDGVLTVVSNDGDSGYYQNVTLEAGKSYAFGVEYKGTYDGKKAFCGFWNANAKHTAGAYNDVYQAEEWTQSVSMYTAGEVNKCIILATNGGATAQYRDPWLIEVPAINVSATKVNIGEGVTASLSSTDLFTLKYSVNGGEQKDYNGEEVSAPEAGTISFYAYYTDKNAVVKIENVTVVKDEDLNLMKGAITDHKGMDTPTDPWFAYNYNTNQFGGGNGWNFRDESGASGNKGPAVQIFLRWSDPNAPWDYGYKLELKANHKYRFTCDATTNDNKNNTLRIGVTQDMSNCKTLETSSYVLNGHDAGVLFTDPVKVSYDFSTTNAGTYYLDFKTTLNNGTVIIRMANVYLEDLGAYAPEYAQIESIKIGEDGVAEEMGDGFYYYEGEVSTLNVPVNITPLFDGIEVYYMAYQESVGGLNKPAKVVEEDDEYSILDYLTPVENGVAYVPVGAGWYCVLYTMYDGILCESPVALMCNTTFAIDDPEVADGVHNGEVIVPHEGKEAITLTFNLAEGVHIWHKLTNKNVASEQAASLTLKGDAPEGFTKLEGNTLTVPYNHDVEYYAGTEDGTALTETKALSVDFPTGVSTIAAENNGVATVYDLNGRVVKGDKLDKGVYIRVINGKSSKIVVK